MRADQTKAATTQPAAGGDVLAIGFGGAVGMWSVGYLAHLPGLGVPSAVVFFLMLGGLVATGVAAQRLMRRGLRGAIYAGLVTGVLNLLILGSVIGSAAENRFAWLWAPTALLVSALLAGAGALATEMLSGRAPPRRVAAGVWPAALTGVALCGTLVLISVGGAVTGFEAGLAVPDWPNTFGYNMFLFPLARMTGGIYFEHSHRLFGALVGLTTLVLLLYLQFVEPRRWVRGLALVALAMVITQGVLGGLRVTGRLTLSQSAEHLEPNLVLAVVHGVLAQLFLATLASLTVVLSPAWHEARPRVFAGAGRDRALGAISLALLLTQLLLGALLRHLSWGLYLHVSLAVIVLMVVGVFAMRAWGLYEAFAHIPRLGGYLLTGLVVQLALGGAALLAVLGEPPNAGPATIQVLITTAHQTVGAALLALTASLVVFHARLVRAPASAAATSASAPLTPETMSPVRSPGG